MHGTHVSTEQRFEVAGLTRVEGEGSLRLVVHTCTIDDGSAYGSGRNSTPLTTLKMAVFAPIPSARVRTAMALKAGRLRRNRKA